MSSINPSENNDRDVSTMLLDTSSMISAWMPYMELSPSDIFYKDIKVFYVIFNYFKTIISEFDEDIEEDASTDNPVFIMGKNMLPDYKKLVEYFNLVTKNEWSDDIDYKDVYKKCINHLAKLVDTINENEDMISYEFEKLNKSLDGIHNEISKLSNKK